MAASKHSDNAKSISIADWQEILKTLIMTKSVMGIPRSDELPQVTRTAGKFRG